MNSVKIALVALSLLTSGLASANLIQNGSFEEGTLVGRSSPADGGMNLAMGSTAITNWTVGVSQVDWLQGTVGMLGSSHSQWGLTAAPGAGKRFVDLTGLSAGPSYGAISQTFTTVIGQVYNLSFMMGSTTGSAPAGGPILNDAAITTVITFGAGPGFSLSVPFDPNPLTGVNKWTPQTAQFTATGTSANLSFLGFSGQNYIGLDNVAVTAVPEPGSIALMLAGLAVVGSIAARRRPQR